MGEHGQNVAFREWDSGLFEAIGDRSCDLFGVRANDRESELFELMETDRRESANDAREEGHITSFCDCVSCFFLFQCQAKNLTMNPRIPLPMHASEIFSNVSKNRLSFQCSPGFHLNFSKIRLYP